jgi:two-component sensor histidine kinase
VTAYRQCPIDGFYLMIERIRNIYNIQIALFIVSIIIVTVVSIYWITSQEIEKRVISQFHGQLSIVATELHYKSLIAVENVKALTSRTMIRKKLFLYACGKISLKEVRNYTASKYHDGASVYKGLLMAERRTLRGDVVVRYEKQKTVFPRIMENNTVSFYKAGKNYNVVFINKIIHGGKHIGYDRAVFSLKGICSSAKMPFMKQCSISRNKDNNCTRDTRLFYALPIGDSGYYLKGIVRPGALKEQKQSMMFVIIIQSVILIAIVAGISYFTIFRLTSRVITQLEDTNDKLSDTLSSKNILLKELNHRIKNNLNMIIGFLTLQSNSSSNEELHKKNNEIIGRINAISTVHEKLQNADDYSQLDIGVYLKDLSSRIIKSSSYSNVNLQFIYKNRIILSSEMAINIGLIVSELVLNSLKHAWHEEGMTITIVVEKTPDIYMLSYEDDGLSFPKYFTLEYIQSLGYLIINHLIESMNGTISLHVPESKKIDIVIPAGGS